MSTNTSGPRPLPARIYVWAGVIAAAIGFGAVYVSRAPSDNAAVQSKPAATATPTGEAARTEGAPPATGTRSPLSTGEMTAFVFKKAPEPLAEVSFTDAAGKPRTLKDWQGRVVLLNLWATWCAPCRKEMPSLERLQKELGSDRFEVVALSVDRGGVEAARKFLDQIKVTGLGLYVDDSMRATSALRAVGMPTTILVGRDGNEIGRLVGPAEWDSADAKRLIEAQLR